MDAKVHEGALSGSFFSKCHMGILFPVFARLIHPAVLQVSILQGMLEVLRIFIREREFGDRAVEKYFRRK